MSWKDVNQSWIWAVLYYGSNITYCNMLLQVTFLVTNLSMSKKKKKDDWKTKYLARIIFF